MYRLSYYLISVGGRNLLYIMESMIVQNEYLSHWKIWAGLMMLAAFQFSLKLYCPSYTHHLASLLAIVATFGYSFVPNKESFLWEWRFVIDCEAAFET